MNKIVDKINKLLGEGSGIKTSDLPKIKSTLSKKIKGNINVGLKKTPKGSQIFIQFDNWPKHKKAISIMDKLGFTVSMRSENNKKIFFSVTKSFLSKNFDMVASGEKDEKDSE